MTFFFYGFSGPAFKSVVFRKLFEKQKDKSLDKQDHFFLYWLLSLYIYIFEIKLIN